MLSRKCRKRHTKRVIREKKKRSYKRKDRKQKRFRKTLKNSGGTISPVENDSISPLQKKLENDDTINLELEEERIKQELNQIKENLKQEYLECKGVYKNKQSKKIMVALFLRFYKKLELFIETQNDNLFSNNYLNNTIENCKEITKYLDLNLDFEIHNKLNEINTYFERPYIDGYRINNNDFDEFHRTFKKMIKPDFIILKKLLKKYDNNPIKSINHIDVDIIKEFNITEFLLLIKLMYFYNWISIYFYKLITDSIAVKEKHFMLLEKIITDYFEKLNKTKNMIISNEITIDDYKLYFYTLIEDKSEYEDEDKSE